MKIAIMATGGVGGYFGARLAAAGQDVHFIARGAHLAALRANGLKLHSANGDLWLRPVAATDDPATIGAADIVLFAVKQYDTVTAAKAIAPLIGGVTGVISLQNGVDRTDPLRAILGGAHVMGGVAYITAAEVASPGVITHVGSVARLIFGERDGSISPRAERFLAACKQAGIDATLSTDVAKELWAKFALLSAFSGVSSVLRKPIGAIVSDRDTRRLLEDAMAETVAVAKANDVDLGADYIARQEALIGKMLPETKSSMQIDLEHHRRLELEWLSGAVARLGEEAGVPTPTHHFIYAALKLYADGQNG
jgi:2-dehydropantoate 2-reductase